MPAHCRGAQDLPIEQSGVAPVARRHSRFRLLDLIHGGRHAQLDLDPGTGAGVEFLGQFPSHFLAGVVRLQWVHGQTAAGLILP